MDWSKKISVALEDQLLLTRKNKIMVMDMLNGKSLKG